MKYVCMVFMLICLNTNVRGEVPRIAVVKPNGVTSIYSNLDAAFLNATNGDAIYLPGGGFNLTYPLTKELHIYGIGINPDSCDMVTSLSFPSLNSNASNTTFEGIVFPNDFDVSASSPPTQNLSIRRCKLEGTMHMEWTSNSNIEECVINGNIGALQYSFIVRNIITSSNSWSLAYCTVDNNIFLNTYTNVGWTDFVTFENNVFLGSSPFYGPNNSNIYRNNLKVGSSPLSNSTTGTETNTMFMNNISDIFISSPIPFGFNKNYQIQVSCVGHNGGFDGTDVGIYGTSTPSVIGWVPSNPHIFYKNVATQSNTNGKLPVHFKVRSGN